jgi:plastocyanin
MTVRQGSCTFVKVIAIAVTLITMTFVSLLATAQDATSQKVTQGVTHTVEIHQFAFKPASLEIKLGDTVVWINKDIAPHTATAVDDSWNSGTIAFNESKSVLFDNDTLLSYYCRFHPAMKAKLTFTMMK